VAIVAWPEAVGLIDGGVPYPAGDMACAACGTVFVIAIACGKSYAACGNDLISAADVKHLPDGENILLLFIIYFIAAWLGV